MKKRFGIDIDGTVTRPDAMVPFINKAFGMNLAYEDITEYDLTPFVHVPAEDFSKWFLENEPHIYAESPIAEGAKKVLGEWMHSADLYFISARHNKLLQITEEWFKTQGLGYHHIELIGSHDKVETAKRCKVDLFFEDKHDNAVAISEQCNIPVILFDTPYNRLPVPDSVIRVHTWLEAEQWVKNWLKQT